MEVVIGNAVISPNIEIISQITEAPVLEDTKPVKPINVLVIPLAAQGAKTYQGHDAHDSPHVHR